MGWFRLGRSMRAILCRKENAILVVTQQWTAFSGVDWYIIWFQHSIWLFWTCWGISNVYMWGGMGPKGGKLKRQGSKARNLGRMRAKGDDDWVNYCFWNEKYNHVVIYEFSGPKWEALCIVLRVKKEPKNFCSKRWLSQMALWRAQKYIESLRIANYDFTKWSQILSRI